MQYKSTRSQETVSTAEALLRGLAADGGLYVPEVFPENVLQDWDEPGLSYQDVALHVLSYFFPILPPLFYKKRYKKHMEKIASIMRILYLFIHPRQRLRSANCFTAQPWRLKIWHYPFFRIYCRRQNRHRQRRRIY